MATLTGYASFYAFAAVWVGDNATLLFDADVLKCDIPCNLKTNL